MSQRELDSSKIDAAVAEMLKNPALNADCIPDFIEYHVHRAVAKKLMEAIDALPPIDLYGHRIRVVVEPVLGDDETDANSTSSDNNNYS